MTDVAVFGATATGVMAAAAAAKHRREPSCSSIPDRHVGGMVSGGLSWTDVGDTRVLGGLAAALLRGSRGALRRRRSGG